MNKLDITRTLEVSKSIEDFMSFYNELDKKLWAGVDGCVGAVALLEFLTENPLVVTLANKIPPQEK